MTNPRVLISAFLCEKEPQAGLAALYCGKTGIRTLGTRKGTTVFETVPIDHSGIFPVFRKKATVGGFRGGFGVFGVGVEGFEPPTLCL